MWRDLLWEMWSGKARRHPRGPTQKGGIGRAVGVGAAGGSLGGGNGVGNRC